MAAVRVPPSACRTSQSRMMLRSPSASRSTTRAQGAPDQPLDFHGASRRAAFGNFARRARRRGARQHGIFGRHPAFAGAAQKSGHGFFDGRRAQHARVADFDQRRAFRGEQIIRRDFQRPQLVGLLVGRFAFVVPFLPLLSRFHHGVEQQRDQHESDHQDDEAGDESALGLRGFGLLGSGGFEFCQLRRWYSRVAPLRPRDQWSRDSAIMELPSWLRPSAMRSLPWSGSSSSRCWACWRPVSSRWRARGIWIGPRQVVAAGRPDRRGPRRSGGGCRAERLRSQQRAIAVLDAGRRLLLSARHWFLSGSRFPSATCTWPRF